MVLLYLYFFMLNAQYECHDKHNKIMRTRRDPNNFLFYLLVTSIKPFIVFDHSLRNQPSRTPSDI